MSGVKAGSWGVRLGEFEAWPVGEDGLIMLSIRGHEVSVTLRELREVVDAVPSALFMAEQDLRLKRKNSVGGEGTRPD